MIRVFLVDDHEIVRGGIARLVDADPGMQVVGEAGSVKEARRRIAVTEPHVAVLDVRLPDGNGVDLCRDIRSAHPSIACVMLTAFDDDSALRAAALAGASGYVLKEVRGTTLLDSIRSAAAGHRIQPASALRKAALSMQPASPEGQDEPLSYREKQVLDLIADGLTNREIGERLGLAEKTVKNYVSALLAKLGMARRTQAAVYGAEHRGRAR